jgi:DNA polymerase I-like protein with 3'-5' exonuclease and polymerase domains
MKTSKPHLVLDVETTTSNKGNPFDTTNKLCYVGIDEDVYNIEFDDDPYKDNLLKIQESIDSATVLVGFNIKFDLHWLTRYGITFANKRIWDCQLVQFILDGQANPYPSLNGVAQHYGLESKLDIVSEQYWKNGIDTPDIPEDILTDYLKQDVKLTEQIMIKQMEELNKQPHLKRLVSLHNQDLLVLQEMEFNGILYDYDKSKTLGDELEEQIAKLDKRLYMYHQFDSFNPNSVDHLSAFLYGGTIKYKRQRPVGHYKSGSRAGEVKLQWFDEEIELPRKIKPLAGSELAKEGLYSTDEKTLRSLKPNKEGKEILDILLTRATLEKRRSTYYVGLCKLIDDNNWTKGEIHGQLNQCVARTGRLSSSRPNLQNFDGEIKSLFLSRFSR